jgi:hypothetical protein
MNKIKKSKATISIRILNGFFMNQFQPPPQDPTDKTPLYKNIARENLDFDTAL